MDLFVCDDDVDDDYLLQMTSNLHIYNISTTIVCTVQVNSKLYELYALTSSIKV